MILRAVLSKCRIATSPLLNCIVPSAFLIHSRPSSDLQDIWESGTHIAGIVTVPVVECPNVLLADVPREDSPLTCGAMDLVAVLDMVRVVEVHPVGLVKCE